MSRLCLKGPCFMSDGGVQGKRDQTAPLKDECAGQRHTYALVLTLTMIQDTFWRIRPLR